MQGLLFYCQTRRFTFQNKVSETNGHPSWEHSALLSLTPFYRPFLLDHSRGHHKQQTLLVDLELVVLASLKT